MNEAKFWNSSCDFHQVLPLQLLYTDNIDMYFCLILFIQGFQIACQIIITEV